MNEIDGLNYLPVGTIVKLKKGNMRVIIIGRIPLFEDSNDKISFYDYIGAIMPMGFDLNHSIYFNKIDVDRIVYRGYVDELEINFQGDLDKWLSSNNERLQKRQI